MTRSSPPSATARPARTRVLRDQVMRLWGVPLLGLTIPQLTGVLGDLSWRQPGYWVGVVYFLVFAGGIWEGNRWILFRIHARYDWLTRPRQRIGRLLLYTALFTLPATVGAVVLWFVVGPLETIVWPHVLASAIAVEVAVIAVTNMYEVWFLITDRFEDQLDLERVERARLRSELDVLTSQLAPHFLFNCLHTLNVLIAEDPAAARTFNHHLAQVCRYLLEQQRRELVPLAEEQAFFDAYVALSRLRFSAGLRVEVRGFEDTRDLAIPPASLQLLLENAIKHNAISEENPLVVTVTLSHDVITVSNPLSAARPPAPSSTQVGLRNLQARFRLTVGRPIEIERADGVFRVRLPLSRREARLRAAWEHPTPTTVG